MGRPNRSNRFTTWRTYSSSSPMLSSTPLVSEIESIRPLTASTIDSISSRVFLPAVMAGTWQYLQRNTHPLVTVIYACLGQWRATGSSMPGISTSPSFRTARPAPRWIISRGLFGSIASLTLPMPHEKNTEPPVPAPGPAVEEDRKGPAGSPESRVVPCARSRAFSPSQSITRAPHRNGYKRVLRQLPR